MKCTRTTTRYVVKGNSFLINVRHQQVRKGIEEPAETTRCHSVGSVVHLKDIYSCI